MDDFGACWRAGWEQRPCDRHKKPRNYAGLVDVPGLARTAPDGVPEGPEK